MKPNCFVSLLSLLAAAGLACAQPPNTPPPPGPAVPSPRAAGDPPPCPGPAGPCPSSTFISAEADYLPVWWVRSERFTPSLFTRDPSLTAPGNLAEGGRDESRRSSRRPLSGGRFSLGYWLEDYDALLSSDRRLPLAGVEGSGFFLGERSLSLLSGPAPLLFRPFFDLNNGVTNAVIVAFPGLARGELSGSAQYQLWGGEANVWCNVCADPPGQVVRADVMAGFRYLRLDGSVQINQNTLFGPNLAAFPAFLPFAGDRLQVSDFFGVDNRYYGGQVGLRVKFLLEDGEFSATFKYGVGTTQQRLTIDGSQVRTAANGAQTRSVGGLLALPSNIGRHSRDHFAQLPEVNVNATVNASKNLSFHLGYSVLYLSNIIRAGDQIDRVVDISQLPNFPAAAGAVPTGLGRPAVLFRDTGLLVHGLNFGVTVTW